MKDTTTAEGELLIPDQNTVAKAFESDITIVQIVEVIEKECRAIHLSVSTPADRKAIASLAYKISRSKTAADAIGKGLTEEATKKIAEINGRRNTVKNRLDTLRDEIRKPLDEWEAADDLRKDRIKTRLAEAFGLRALPENSFGLRAVQDEAIAIELDDTWQEFLEDATKAKDAFVRLLGGKIADAVRIEEREAELERERQVQAAELLRLREAEAQRQREDQAAKAAQAVKDAEIAALKAQLAAMQEQALPAPVGQPVAAEKPEAERFNPLGVGKPLGNTKGPLLAPVTSTLSVHYPSGQVVASDEPEVGTFSGMRQAICNAILTAIEPTETHDEAAAALTDAILLNEIPYVTWSV